MFIKNTAISRMLLTGAVVSFLTACGSIGNMGAVQDGLHYGVDCEPDKALKALDQAEADGGLSGHLAQLERIVVLQDAGRTQQATTALDEYMALPNVEGQSRADVEKSIKQALEDLRKERESQTGKRTCP